MNLELKSVDNVDRINILDVLKPQQEEGFTEEFTSVNSFESIPSLVETDGSQQTAMPSSYEKDNNNKADNINKIAGGSKATTTNPSSSASATLTQSAQKPSVKVPANSSENITRWVVDANFRKVQEKLKIPLGIVKNFLFLTQVL